MSQYRALSYVELTGLLKSGNTAAFTEIYDRYWCVLFLHARNLLRDEEEARDIVQELFTGLWQKAADFQANTYLSAYLYRSVRNKVFDHIKHRKVVNEYVESLSEFMEQGEIMADALVREKELAKLIENEIAHLPKKMRTIFELSRKQHLSYSEIAERLDISEHSVKSQVSNALRVIRTKLGPAGIAVLYVMDHIQRH